MAEKKAALERARRKGAITPFPGQNGYNDSPSENGGKRIDITELDAGMYIFKICSYLLTQQSRVYIDREKNVQNESNDINSINVR